MIPRSLMLGAFLVNTALAASDYRWKSVQVHGGGYVDGFVFSRAAEGILYARTDVGGAYRWNSSSRTWTSLSDGWPTGGDWGVLSIATDPTDPGRVYMATGGGGYGKLYASDDQGATWSTFA